MTNVIPEYAGCPWPMDPACETTEWESYDPDVQDRSLALASSTLHRLTGYRVGNCPVVVRPTNSKGHSLCYLPVADPTLFSPGIRLDGHWVNGCGTSEASCTITLPRPVGAVYEVKVDGDVVDPSDYIVDGHQIIWRGDSECPWPLWQDVTKPDTEEGTLSVTFLNAAPVDSLGAHAVGILALEFAKACTGASKCRLRSGVAAVVRAGVTFEINPCLFPGGFTGIRTVDAYIAIWNPRGSNQRQASSVWSPDLRSTGVTGG